MPDDSGREPRDSRQELDEALDQPLEDRLRAALAKLELDADDETLAALNGGLADIEASAERRAAQLSHIDREFDERMAKLERRLDTAQAARESERRETRRQQGSDQKSAQGLGLGLSVGYAIIGMPILGYGIALLVDGHPGGPNSAWLVLLGTLIGFVGAGLILKRSGMSD